MYHKIGRLYLDLSMDFLHLKPIMTTAMPIVIPSMSPIVIIIIPISIVISCITLGKPPNSRIKFNVQLNPDLIMHCKANYHTGDYAKF